MTDYLDRVEAQLVARAVVLYAPTDIDVESAGARIGVGGSVLNEGSLRAFTGFCSAAVGTLVVALMMLSGANPAPSDVTVARGKGGVTMIGVAGPSGFVASRGSTTATFGQLRRGSSPAPRRGADRAPALSAAPS